MIQSGGRLRLVGAVGAPFVLLLGVAGCETSVSPAPEPACAPPAGASGAPSTIEDVVTLVNALVTTHGHPLTLTCLIQSLDRPLSLLAANSVFSLQPSDGPGNPRVFLWTGNVVMSVIPAGIGQNRLELAENSSPTRSVKGEIAFPVESTLPLSAPYDRILATGDRDGSICGGCHPAEERAKQVANVRAFESAVLRPTDSQEIAIPFLRDQARACDRRMEPDRCRLLAALFAGGDATVRHFPTEVPTIYGP